MLDLEEIELTSSDELTLEIVESGLVSFADLIRSVRCFHYGRNTNRHDLSLVWRERKGTCSSKHAFVKHIANLNGVTGLDLVMGMYLMTSENTPGIGNILKESPLDGIPEAHCYLNYNSNIIDITSITSDFEKIKGAIIEEKVIEPHQVAEEKIVMHQTFLKNWLTNEQLDISFDEVWKLRERCIAELSNGS